MLPVSPPWTLHQLEAAYRQGYLEALLERQPRRPTHDILSASWEAGWRDGAERLRQHRSRATEGVRTKLPMAVRIRHAVSAKDRL